MSTIKWSTLCQCLVISILLHKYFHYCFYTYAIVYVYKKCPLYWSCSSQLAWWLGYSGTNSSEEADTHSYNILCYIGFLLVVSRSSHLQLLKIQVHHFLANSLLSFTISPTSPPYLICYLIFGLSLLLSPFLPSTLINFYYSQLLLALWTYYFILPFRNNKYFAVFECMNTYYEVCVENHFISSASKRSLLWATGQIYIEWGKGEVDSEDRLQQCENYIIEKRTITEQGTRDSIVIL